MVSYYLGYFAEQLRQPEKALGYYQAASRMPSDYVFPFQYEAIDVLRHAMAVSRRRARALLSGQFAV